MKTVDFLTMISACSHLVKHANFNGEIYYRPIQTRRDNVCSDTYLHIPQLLCCYFDLKS